MEYKEFCRKQNEEILALIEPLPRPHLASNKYVFPTPQNVVSTFNINIKINLSHLSSHINNGEYKPDRFAAIVLREQFPNTTILAFPSGKSVSVGAKSEENTIVGAQRYRWNLIKYGYKPRLSNIIVHNKVYNGVVGHELDLAEMYENNKELCIYVPDTFPGLIIYVKIWTTDRTGKQIQHKTRFLAFPSGKFIGMSITKKGDEIVASNIIIPEFRKYKKEAATLSSSEGHRKRIKENLQKKKKTKPILGSKSARKVVSTLEKQLIKKYPNASIPQITSYIQEELKRLKENPQELKTIKTTLKSAYLEDADGIEEIESELEAELHPEKTVHNGMAIIKLGANRHKRKYMTGRTEVEHTGWTNEQRKRFKMQKNIK